MMDVIVEFLDEWMGLLLFVGFVVLVGGVMYCSVSSEQKKQAIVCAKMWSAAHNGTDSIAVYKACNLPSDNQTVVIPVPVYVGK